LYCRERAFQFVGILRLDYAKLHLQRAGRLLSRLQQASGRWTRRIGEHGDTGKLGYGLLEQFKLFAADLKTSQQTQPGDIPARPRQASDEPGTNRIGRRSCDDRDLACRILSGQRRCGSRRKDDVYLEMKQLASEFRKTRILFLAITVLNSDVLPVHVAEVAQALPKRLGERRTDNRQKGPQYAYTRDFLRLLRPGGRKSYQQESNQ